MIDVKIEIKNKKTKENYELKGIDEKFQNELYGILAKMINN